MSNILKKKAKEDKRSEGSSAPRSSAPSNPFLRHPTLPESAFLSFLQQVRGLAMKQQQQRGKSMPVNEPLLEIEARLGILKAPFGLNDRRVLSSGPKQSNGKTVPAFHCSASSNGPVAMMESGVSRLHWMKWTGAGLSESSGMSQALGCRADIPDHQIKQELQEIEYIETVYAGYPQDRRVCYSGLHPAPPGSSGAASFGKMETKERLIHIDLAIPAAAYDLRIQVATEKALAHASQIGPDPPPGWTTKRIKRRRSYTRKDKSIAWQIDVTEVTTSTQDPTKAAEVVHEIEMELNPTTTMKLMNEEKPEATRKMAKSLAQQLWWILHNLNPLTDIVDAEEFLRDHPSKPAVAKAQAMCGALKKFMDSKQQIWTNPCVSDDPPSPALQNVKFTGCMPINFSRHNIEEVQRSPENGYFLSEKTDGVRHFLVFTGNGTAVLVDRAMRGKQPIPRSGNEDPLGYLCHLIKPGTVMDGEVVMHRKLRRPVFIVFDVMATPDPILHLPFEQRLRHLRKCTFRTPNANRDMFDPLLVQDPKIAMPLVRKNFVKRQDLDELLSKVNEEKGIRFYRSGDSHNHLTDGIIFQPNLPYVCGTDVNLLKWKYLDTVTIDVELLPPREEGELRMGCLGDEQTRVDMTRHLHLPNTERRRLEADREEHKCNIAEVGFDPTTGEWYYLTMRPDKIAPNHISTVLGTLLELAESLTTEELRYRMSVPPGSRDTYRKDVRTMQKQLLDHQRKKNKTAKQQQHGQR